MKLLISRFNDCFRFSPLLFSVDIKNTHLLPHNCFLQLPLLLLPPSMTFYCCNFRSFHDDTEYKIQRFCFCASVSVRKAMLLCTGVGAVKIVGLLHANRYYWIQDTTYFSGIVDDREITVA